jgi:site-specific DNA-adenine methylase
MEEMVTRKYSNPFPWFGGKSRIADKIWKLFGDVDVYIEPFFGAGYIFFNRPNYDPGKHREIINDKDMLIANFWRAVKEAPQEVAYWADNPINEADLTARHIWLVKYGIPDLTLKIQANPDYYDAKIAGWWVWGIACYIGGGWCRGDGKWSEEDGKLVRVETGGASIKRPHATSYQGIHKKSLRPIGLEAYFQNLSERLRYTIVFCGDWKRAVTKGVLSKGSRFGIFLDPPYDQNLRSENLYNIDDLTLSKEVNQWCVENGDNPKYRIALCGYEGEHNNLEELGWKKFAWVTGRSYGTSKGKSPNSENRFLERVWYNRYCLEELNLC